MNAKLYSHNPADGSVVWEGHITGADQAQAVMGAAHRALADWRSTSTQQRVEIMQRYAEQLTAGQQEITRLISEETGKLLWDAAGEVKASIAKVELSIRAWQERRVIQHAPPDTENAPHRVIRYVPLGVALVLGPFNFPLHLPGGQIIPALLAGNTVVFKPSEHATAVGQWMVEAWRRAGLPHDVLRMIPGRTETAVAAIDSPHTAAVFLTGSLAAGRAIHRQLAGRPEVMLALEMGGNNPVVVMPDADPSQVARLLSFSAFVTAGQRCTCARRAIFVDGPKREAQVEALLSSTGHLTTGICGDQPAADVGPLINHQAVGSMRQSYDELIASGCKPLIPFATSDRSECLLSPMILDGNPLDVAARKRLGEMEWFGPMLIVQHAADFAEAIAMAADTPYGLAAAMLGGDESQFERFVTDVGAGVVNWNGPTTGAAGVMPFGGLGSSGNHRPAGYYAIDFCNDPVASLQRGDLPSGDPWSVVQ